MMDALRRSALRVLELEQRLEMERRERDDLALRLVDQGHTWREVADAAGFANPYIATLKKRMA